MTIQAQLADGRVLEFPDGTDPKVIQATVKRVIANPLAAKSTEALESAESAPMSFGDTFKSLSSGVVGGGKSIVDFFGAGTDVSKGLGEAQSFLQQSLTPERKAEISRREELQSRAAQSGSMFQEAKAFLGGVAEAPIQSLAQAAGSSVPAIAVGILALPVEAPAAIALGVGTIAKLTVGAIQGVGEYKGSVFDAVKAEYMKQGKSEQEAEALAIKSQEYSRDKAFEIGGSALLGALDAVSGAEPGVAKALRKAAPTGVLTKEAIEKGVAALPDKAISAPSYLGQFVKGVAAEAPLEGSQGAFGQYGQNVALQQAGADVTPMQGVLGAGLRDAAVGALFGGAASPLGMKPARQEYATDQFLRQAKEDIELDKRAADTAREKREQIQKTQSQLGVPVTGENVSNVLMLPAPGKKYEEPKNPLVDPVGRITEAELGKVPFPKGIGSSQVVNYIKAYRKENNLPPLKTYSLEDIKDAMTAQSPEGEEGALNAILAYKTNYQNETYTPQDIQNIAVAKNVATETKGFSDFLTRATGKADLNTMTQPELHSVATALDALQRTGKEEQLVLPEGSNATRFTQDQYNTGLTTALGTIKPGKPVSLEQAKKAIQVQTGLETDRDAESLLRTAAINDDLTIDRGTGYQAVSPTGVVLGTYGTESEAKRMHRRAEIKPIETELVTPRIEEATRPETDLPEGYQIQKEDTVGSEAPAAYVIREDGSQKNASQTFSEEVDAKERLNILARKREANAAAEEAAAERVRQDLEKRQAAIAQMEADGKTGTPEHTKAVYTYQAANVAGSQKITDHLDKAEALRTPLKIVPLGKKSTKVAKHTVIKEGKVVASFDTNDKAQAHVLSLLNDKDLGSIVKRGGTMGQRAKVELDMRERPGVRGGTTAGLEAAGVHTPDVEAQLQELRAKLIPMLKKFGLEQVGLNVVRAIENDADGAWGKADKLIRIALQATKPIQTMRHEALHALKELGFFTPQQWEALKRQAEKTWVNTYLKGQMVEVNGKKMTRYDAYANGVKNDDGSWALKPLSPEDIIEEAIADAFGSWEGGQKPPPGLMAALFKRMQQFFTALREALTGAGFESAEDIFGKIERGELKAAAVPTPSKIDSKMSLRQANYNKDPDRLEVSTARPTALRPMPGEIAPRDPIKDFYVIDSEDIMSVPAHMASAHNAISTYNWFPVSEDPNATIRAMKDTIVDNLVWLYNLTPENIRNRAKLWYNGANRIAKDWSKVYGYSLRQMAGVLAVLSPQKDWFMNTSLGERVVHVYTQRQNDKWSPDMTAWADSYVKAARDIETRDKRQVVFDAAKRLEGTKLKDMNIEDMAYFVRVFDETYHSRKYRVITPEGMFGDYVTVNEEVGEDEDASGGQGDVAWGTYDSIKKAISILQDGSQENISEQLGDEHKVRNFNNNIVDPDSASGSVTIDTHAVGAASFKALSGASLEVLHNFGTTPKGLVSAGGSAMTGASGTYGFIADAYREAAAMVGVLPREMQSITWEAIRSIFPAAWKSQNASNVNAIYDRFKAGEITLKEARDEVLKISGGIKKFAWENDKSGAFPSTGATSFDVNKQDARVLQPYQIKEKLKINLSAAPSMEKGAEVIPGIKYLFDQTKQEDMAAYTLLQEVATDNIRHLLSGIENVKVATVPASGLFDESFEPSVNLAVTFNYGEKGEVLPALKRFAGNFKQKQIHVRQVSKLDVETEYEDGSYNTPVFTFKLEESFNRTEIKSIVRESGLPGITFTDNQVVAYFLRGKKSDTAEKFYGQIEKLAEQLGGFVSAIDRTVERLWVYGSGFGATQGYSAIKGNVRPGTGVTVKTAKRVAAYINNVRDGSIKTFDNADITDEQANKQNVIGDMYDKLPIDDMDRPIVRKAYEALAPALLEQYRALPITVTWSKKKNKKGQPVDAYGSDSAAMRKDILENNRLQILPTTPDSFGPEGYDFSGHPLLQETGLMLDGRPLLYNDLLRAVHDYYAHGMTEVGFGPKGEEAGWKNHMSMTKDPLARWALTMETRAQNSYVNFRSGLDRSKVPLNKRGFAMQKAALLPVNVALTGNTAVDKPMKEFIKTLTKDEKLGSAGDIKLAPSQKPKSPAKDQKLSLRQVRDIFDRAEKISEPPGVESIRQQWIGGVSGIGDRDSMYDLYRVNGSKKYIQDVQDFVRKELGDDFKGYRLMSNDELEELETGAMGSQFASFTLNPDVARAFKNIPAYAEKTGMSVVEMDLTPEHVAMIGHPGELELVVDYGQGYNPSNVKVVEKYSLRAAPDTKEFKQWFGNSKVVDTEGNPLVVYHATPKDFAFFDPRKLTKNTKHPTARLGFFTAVNPESTVEFISATKGIAKGMYEEGANIMPLYASIQNPAVIPSGQFVMQSMALQNMRKKDADKYIDDYLQSLRDEGHDGILIEADKTGRGLAGGNEFTSDNWVVLDASQLKSAIGNVGSYGQRVPTAEELKKLKIPVKKAAELQEKGDVRFSLSTYFPTAEEAENAAYKKAPPGTAEFKRFFGGSRVMEEGRAQPMFHASMEDFNIFRENRPIFVSPDASFAEEFIKRRIRESGSLSYLSEGKVKKKTAKIYPLWVRAETPFDYDNDEHIQQIVGYLQANNQATGNRIAMGGGLGLVKAEDLAQDLSSGRWTVVENSKTQEALKALGFDSFYTLEGGAKNLAVFKANQVKSITGNLGSFDESGDIRYSLRSAPTTPEFKRWFSSSKVVNEDGSPKVMYHGTNKDFNKFVIAEKANRTGMPDGFYFTSDQEDASRYAKGEGANVLPVYLSIKNPFNLGGKNKISKEMVMQFRDELRADNPSLPFSWIQEKVNIFKENTTAGRFPFPSINFPTAAMQRVFEVGGYDGLIDGGRVFVAFNSSQVKSATGNTGAFDRANPDIRYSLKPVSADIDAAIDRTTTAREDKGFIGRIVEAIFPQSAGHFRQQALNRYNQLGVYDRMLADKMGGAAMLADQSAESAALMSDLSASVTASAFGYGNRTGGVPVYKNGITTIDTSVKGPIAILAQLAKYNNPRIYQRYQFWAGVKRAERLLAEGREKNFEQADIARAAILEKDYPEFVQIQKEMNEFNNGLVKYMVQTGVLDPAKGQIYMQHADYIPFYRQMDGERTIGPNIFQSISGVKPPKALEGGKAPVADYLETIVRNTQAAIQSGMKNVAAQRAVNVAMQLGPKAGAQRLNTQESGFDIVQVLEKGERVSYRVADTLFIDACRSLNLPDLPFMGFLAFPANALRNLVTKDPGFMLANLMRDSLSSWVTSGTSVKPIIGTVAGFAKALSGKSASMEALLNAGILGGYEFSSGVLRSGEVLEADLNKKYGKATGAKVLLKPFTSLWDALEKGTEASDAATRIAIYERVLADTGNEAEAIFRSLEVMNFNRKGSSAIIRIATAAIPFLNARMQGLDIFYRASFGRDTVADPAAKQKAFFVRGATLMALSIAMYTMVSDDDEYKKQEEETKDNYWIIPGVGKFPTPFEVGFLFKTVPERIYAYMFKDDTGEDLKESMKRGIISTLAFNPIPQTAKPLIEAAWNYNSFTGRAIVGAGMEGRSAEFQVGPSTSEVAEKLGGALGLSPLKIDHVLQGYTGTIGMYLVQLTDSVLSANDNSPRAAKRFEQLPIIKRFAVDPEARGNITQFYALKNATEQAVTTANFLERAGDPEVFVKYLEENAGLLANKDYVQSIEKEMKTLREARSMIQSADMGAEEKRDLLIDIGRVENALTENTKEVKKIFKEQ